LALSAGEFGRTFVGVALEMQTLEKFFGADVGFVGRQSVDGSEGEHDVREGVKMGEEVPRLEDGADVAAVDAERFSGGRNGFVVDAERSLFGRLQSADEAQESGFAAAGRSE
jgi:hypothetical protein